MPANKYEEAPLARVRVGTSTLLVVYRPMVVGFSRLLDALPPRVLLLLRSCFASGACKEGLDARQQP